MQRSLSRVFLFSTISTLCAAQNFRGSISGLVADSSGALVPSAAIKATNGATGLDYETASTDTGGFTFRDLPLGDYTVIVSASGFQTLKIDGVHVSAGQIYDLRPALEITKAKTTVEVNASALEIETSSTAMTDVLPQKTVQNLPMNGRDFTQFLAMTPGFTGYPGQGMGSMNGSRSTQFNWQIDGADNNDAWLNNPAANQGGVNNIAGVLLPLEAIEEVSTETQGSAEQGRNPGATINLVIKSGTNELHGSAYYYNRNEFFAARAPFAPADSPTPELRNQNYGFSLGGPILKNRTFYFINYEEQKFVIGNPGLSTEPSAAYQAETLQMLRQYNIPVLPAAQTLLSTLWPASSLTGPAQPDNYFGSGKSTGRSYNGLIKIDHSFDDNNRLSFRWFAGAGPQTAPLSNPSTGSLDINPYYYNVAPSHVQNYDLVYDRILSSRLTNQLLFGVNYYAQTFDDANESFNPVALGFNTGVTDPALRGAPQICIGNFDCTGIQSPSGRQDITGHVTDALSFDVGAHQIRLGAEFRETRVDDFNRDGARGIFTFTGTQGPWSGLLNTPSVDPNVPALADFLAGYIAPGAASIVVGNQERLIHVNEFSVFVHDTWQATPRLSLNYGLRWEYQGPPHTGQPNLSLFDPTVPGGLAVIGKQVQNIFPRYWKAFAPRGGFAFQPAGTSGLAIRGGVGLYYDTPPLATFFEDDVSNGGPPGVKDNPAGSEPVFTLSPATTTITQNNPIFPEPSLASVIASGNTINLFTVSPDFRPAYTISYNLNVQKNVGKSVMVQAGYVGTLGRRLPLTIDINQPLPSASGVQQISRPFYSQYPYIGVINQISSIASSNYNGLQTLLKTQEWHGLVSQFSYTWSHALDNDALDNAAWYNRLPQNSYDLASEYGNSNYDARHSFKAQIIYTVPNAPFGPKILSNGWQISGNLYFQTGLPLTISASGDLSGTGEFSDRANQVSDPFQGVSHQFNPAGVQWLNPNAFVNPQPGTYGTTGRNQYAGPGYSVVDLAVLKNIPIKERLRAQFRIEMFNIFNHLNLAPPNTTVGSGLGLAADTIGDYQGAPGIGPGEPFNMQFALKFLW